MKSKVLIFLLFIFHCTSAQQFRLLSPQDESIILNNRLLFLKWTVYDHSQLNFEYSKDNGVTWSLMNLSDTFPSDTGAIWFLPDTSSMYFKVRLSLMNDSSVFVQNNLPFTIYYPFYDFISTNEILMWIGNNGMGSNDPRTGGSGFYWPGDDSAFTSAIYQDGLIWGGKVNGEIKVNANTYRQGLSPGKILEDGLASNPLLLENKIYKIRKDWQSILDDTLRQRLEFDYNNWPVKAGAPWYDVNLDGLYTAGFDAPVFIGDETLFYTANDLDTVQSKYAYGSDPIGLEFQTTVFGFNREDLKDVLFKKYKIINKSKSDVKDMFISYWADNDMGYAEDDFVGCDVNLSLGYTWNGDNYDEGFYGMNPPAIGHMIVQSPIIGSSESDSAFFNFSWIKGYKNISISSFCPNFKNFHMIHDPDLGDYTGTIELYNGLLRGKTNEGDYLINPITGEIDTFALSGDPVSGIGWYEGEGWPGGIPPGDRRYYVNSGPFNFSVGDTQEVCIAILIARGTDNINSITKLRELAAHVQEFYNTELVEILNTKETIAPSGYTLFQNYPNPFNPKTTIEYEVSEKSNVTIKIYDILGREVKTLVNNEEKVRWKYKVEFDATNIASGVYFYRMQVSPVSGAGSFTQTKKMVVLK